MGLQERRAVQAFRDERFDELQAEIEAVTEFPVDLDVEWDTFSDDNRLPTDEYAEAFENVYFRPLVEAFSEICVDDLGRDALESGLDGVRLTNDEGLWGSQSVTFDAGVLTIDHEPDTNVDRGDDRTDAIVDELNPAL